MEDEQVVLHRLCKCLRYCTYRLTCTSFQTSDAFEHFKFTRSDISPPANHSFTPFIECLYAWSINLVSSCQGFLKSSSLLEEHGIRNIKEPPPVTIPHLLNRPLHFSRKTSDNNLKSAHTCAVGVGPGSIDEFSKWLFLSHSL